MGNSQQLNISLSSTTLSTASGLTANGFLIAKGYAADFAKYNGYKVICVRP